MLCRPLVSKTKPNETERDIAKQITAQRSEP